MADEAARDPGPFNVETVRRLIQLMDRHDLNEILLEEGNARIRLRRGFASPVVAAPLIPTVAPPAQPAPSTAATTTSKPTAGTRVLHEIKSPMVGTFYKAANPDAEPFVKLGAKVSPTTVVGIIEAMKLYNDIAAECSGTIAEICVENAQPVDFNTVLFRVDPAG